MRSYRKTVLTAAASLLVATLIGVGCVARYYRVYSIGGFRTYVAMAKECPPAWRDFHFGRFRAGADIEEVIRVTKPCRVERHGNWVTLHYRDDLNFSGLVAHAQHGRLVLANAGSCAWVRVLVDDMTEEQSQELMGVSLRDPRRFGIVPVYR